jgi:hypothetical protein
MVAWSRRTEAFLKAGHAAFSDGPVAFEQEPYLCQHLASLNICDVQQSSSVRQRVPQLASGAPCVYGSPAICRSPNLGQFPNIMMIVQ